MGERGVVVTESISTTPWITVSQVAGAQIITLYACSNIEDISSRNMWERTVYPATDVDRWIGPPSVKIQITDFDIMDCLSSTCQLAIYTTAIKYFLHHIKADNDEPESSFL